ncbi:MAG: TonB-dependent receptor [Caulobacteraceae bacterium]|nr:TonB-dependent receptor [Caulobacteraceae bacterium]
MAGVLPVAGAQAAPRRVFDVRPQPLTRALLDFALQANISIGADDAARCGPASRGVKGQMTMSQALGRILAGTGCGFRMVDPTTARIVRQAPPAPPAVAHAPPTVVRPPGRETDLVSPVPEVVVTATRRGAATLRLPDAIRAISGERMAMERDDGIGDLAGWTAGLTVTNLGPGSDKIIIRGLSDSGLTGHAQSTVGIYLDDTRLTYNTPDPDLRLTDIERVEVLQGPQGTLYGSGSIAGLVHIVTREPNLSKYEGEISVTGAGTVGGDPSAVVEGVVNAPLLPGQLAVRAVAYREHDGGYIDDTSLGKANANATDRTGFRLAVKANLNSDWSADFGVVGQALASADSQYTVARLGAYARNIALQEPHSNDFAEAHLTVEGDIAPGQFRNTISVVRHDIDTRYDASSAATLSQFVSSAVTGPAAYQDDEQIEAVVDEATLASAGSSPLQWLLGGFFSTGRQRLDSAITTTPLGSHTPTPVYVEHRTDRIDELALYGEATYDITSKLAISAGARGSLTNIATRSMVTAPLTGESAPFHGRMSTVKWEPKLSLRYQFSDRSMIYLLASEGARGGGFNTSGPVGESFSGPGGSSEPFRRFNGDELWNMEVGVKTRTLGDHLDVRAAVFYAVWSNIQSDELLPSGLPYTANIGDGRNVGLETEFAYSIGGLELRLASLLDEPELNHNSTPFPALLHSGLPGVPRGSVGASAHYEAPPVGGLRPFFEADVDYVGQSRLTFDARTTRRMGDYTVGRVTAGLASDRWRASAFVDNVFGVVGDTFAYGNPFTLRHEHQITPLRPRTFGLQFTRSF